MARTPFVLATVVRAERPTSARAGDRAIVMPDGTMEGFVGGVCAESTVRLEGLRLLGREPGTGESTLLRITPTDDGTGPVPVSGPAAAEGMVVVGNPCLSGGTLDIFLEAVLPAARMYVFGDAPIARALTTLAQAAGYAVTASADPTGPIPPDTAAVVVASHGRAEESVLAAALLAGVPYVGLVASPRRGAAVLSDVDVAEELRARVHTPAGLNIGARTPLEIAVSVVAEVIASLGAVTVTPAPPPPDPRALPVPASATDPVCGMSVAAVPASPHTEYGGTTWYFCGPGCQQAFAADPTGA